MTSIVVTQYIGHFSFAWLPSILLGEVEMKTDDHKILVRAAFDVVIDQLLARLREHLVTSWS